MICPAVTLNSDHELRLVLHLHLHVQHWVDARIQSDFVVSIKK